MAPRKKKSPVPWGKSKAKELLFQDIAAGRAVGTAREIYSSRPEYAAAQPNFNAFAGNFYRLRKWIAKHQERADEDAAALAHDVLENPRAMMDPRGYPRWDQSDAFKLLKQDIADGKQDEMAPQQLHQSRDEYKDFPLEVFRNHIYQELREIREKAYWWPRMYGLLEPPLSQQQPSTDAAAAESPAPEPTEPDPESASAAGAGTNDWYD